jgi:ketosteroid isomerase-like protein
MESSGSRGILRAMSQENLDLVVRAIQAAIEQPKPDFETVNALYHPDHVLVPLGANALGEGEAKGAAGYKRWLRETDDAVSWEGELKGAVDVGPDKVLAVTQTRFEGASSGVKTEQRTWNVVTVAEGKLTRTEVYSDPIQALEAAGLRE